MVRWLISAYQTEVLHEALSLYHKGLKRLVSQGCKNDGQREKIELRLVTVVELASGLNAMSEGVVKQNLCKCRHASEHHYTVKSDYDESFRLCFVHAVAI